MLQQGVFYRLRVWIFLLSRAVSAGMFSALCTGFPYTVLPAVALVEIDIVGGEFSPLPVVVPDFADMSGYPMGGEVADIIRNDLAHSGLFSVREFGRSLPIMEAVPEFRDWEDSGAQLLISGQVDHRAQEGWVVVHFQIWDILGRRKTSSGKFAASLRDWRRAPHMISNVIYEHVTGKKGHFDTQIVFVSETGDRAQPLKRLAVMDYDGANLQYLTAGQDLVLTPKASRDGRAVVYASVPMRAVPRIVEVDLSTAVSHILGNFSAMVFSPCFLPQGEGIAFSQQAGVRANVYVLNTHDGRIEQITSSEAIDTSPSFAPDGRRFVFESDRSGVQRLYVQNRDNGDLQSISRGHGAYSTPAWSPDGDWIAFTKRIAGHFQIGIMRPDGSGERILTEGFHNEAPRWAPNGQALVFFRNMRGEEGGPQLWSIDRWGRHEWRIPTPGFASDPDWLPYR